MKQKLPRVLFIKTENISVSNTPAQKRRRILPEYAFRKRFEKREEPDGAVPPVGFENRSGAFGARGPRRSPAGIHGEAKGSEVTSVLTVLFRVGWWSRWSPACTVSTVALAPADGVSDEGGARRRGLKWLN